MKTTLIQPYLFFNGRCDEALDFYKTVLGAQVDMLMRYQESPEPLPAGMLPPGFENKVMHVTFRIDGNVLMASDGCDEDAGFKGFALSLALPTEGEANRVFNTLADGGKVNMPLGRTFWSPCFGMVNDRFGVSWMVTIAV